MVDRENLCSALPSPFSFCPLPTAATAGNVCQLGPRTCASVQKAIAGPRVITRMTPTPVLPSSVTRDNAISPIEGSPSACASLALVGSTASKVGSLCAGEGDWRRPWEAELDRGSRLPTVQFPPRGCVLLHLHRENVGTPSLSEAVVHCGVTSPTNPGDPSPPPSPPP